LEDVTKRPRGHLVYHTSKATSVYAMYINHLHM